MIEYKDLKDVSLETGLDAEKAKDVFVKNWHYVHEGLTALQTIVKNPIVKSIIGLILVSGDAIFNKLA